MATRNVVLTPQQDEFVGVLVETGVYQNASEVIRDGLRLLQEKRARQEAELEDIRRGLLESIAQADRGEFVEGDFKDIIRDAFARARIRAGV